MKKAIVILFMASYLFSTTELSQLLKFPEFVIHFFEHKEQNKDLTLWEFVNIHYAQGDVKYADYDKDMKLPFKTHDNCSAQMNVNVPPSFLIISNKPTYINASKNTFLHMKDRFISSYLSSIWQPPKSC